MSLNLGKTISDSGKKSKEKKTKDQSATNTPKKKTASKKVKENTEEKTKKKKHKENIKSSQAKKKKKDTNKKNKNEDMDDEDVNDEDNFEELVLPGQRYPTPPAGDATRAFYESLLEKRSDSQMAMKYCVEYGCLDAERAQKFIEILEKLKKKKKHTK